MTQIIELVVKNIRRWTLVLNIRWKDRCWSWNSNTLATWCEELIHLKRPWCWERLKAGGEGDDRGWDGWMASLTQRTWVWVNSGSRWWTGRPGMRSPWGRKVINDRATELNWTETAGIKDQWIEDTANDTIQWNKDKIFWKKSQCSLIKLHVAKICIIDTAKTKWGWKICV